MTPRVHRFADLDVTPWRNGLGRRAEVASGPGWTISYAWLDGAAPFSDFPGTDRTFTLVCGAGVRLEVDGEVLVVDGRNRSAAFDGGATVAADLLDGPCLVLNVMTERTRCEHEVRMTHRHPSGRWAAVVQGSVSLVDGGTADPLDVVASADVRAVAPQALLLDIDLRGRGVQPRASRR